ncbi:MAG TPA: copper chaperone PCu(A)C [Acetobacteraceae bacterium]|nr:copper chaperone PCu(A)C [Acetobacteraceae bacterium]
MTHCSRLLPALLCMGFSLPAMAAPQVQVERPWARATAPHQTDAAVYLTLRSPGGDRLIGVGSPMADHASLHETVKENGVSRMRDVPGGIPLPAGQTVTLRPGGFHIMLIGLHHPLVAGQTVTLDLSFEKAGTVEVLAGVEKLGANATMQRDTAMLGRHDAGRRDEMMDHGTMDQTR